MWKDPIVEEVRAHREAHAKKFNYDLDAIVDDLQRRQAALQKEGWKVVKPKPQAGRARKAA